MKRRRLTAATNLLPLVSLLLLLWTSPVTPQTTVNRQDSTENRDALQGNPPGVTFTLRLKDGKTRFKQGELITIEMLFASTLPNTYQVQARTYDRSGRLQEDTYHVDPEVGTSDPLRDYFQSLFGYVGGGLMPFPPPTMEEKPYVIAQDLNEFVRFDKPGKYRLWVTNNRIARIDPHNRYRSAGQFQATSSTIEIEILPAEAEWQKQKVQEARAILNAEKPTDRRAACRALRFFNSEEAETEMIRQYRGNTDGCEGEFHLGLVSSPRREFVIHEMETRMTAPDHPVTSSFIHTLVSLTYLARYGSMPPYPAGDEAKMKQWQSEMQQRRDAVSEITEHYSQELYETVASKEKSARAVSLETLLEFEANVPYEKRTAATAARVEQTAAALPGIFLDLPTGRQNTLLTTFWKPMASPAMVPVLRQIIEKPSAPQEGTYSDLRGIALQRLFELAPEEGRKAILAEIRRTPLRVRPQALGILPDETLPELDEILSEKITRLDPESEFQVVADYSALIARYATGASLPSVKKVLTSKVGRLACAIQTALIAFCLRVDPDYGADVLEQALAARKDTGCYKFEFEAVGRLYPSSKLEEIAAVHLDDSETAVAVQAATLLGQHGSARAEQPLMDRLERWHTQWSGNEKEIQPQIENGEVAGEPAQFERELVRALVTAQAWVADLEKLNRIRQLCLTSSGRRAVDEASRDWNEHSIRVVFGFIDNDPHEFSVGQYRPVSVKNLKDKLTQFSKGTVFVWKPASDNLAAEQLFTDLKEFLAKYGMKLEKPDK